CLVHAVTFRFAGAIAGDHATKLLSDCLHRMGKTMTSSTSSGKVRQKRSFSLNTKEDLRF
ncbi:hypothetical protein, partial [Streptococcus pneumoniae]|uniref:hypothetical protein n=1 Tax=Streptococcus pneumoniae TaxID=1313 RepID=UPI00195445A1